MDREKAYKHDYSGKCAPAVSNTEGIYRGQETFSVGIFQWRPKASGKGLKKSVVKYRVRGRCSDAAEVYKHAECMCGYFDLECAETQNMYWQPRQRSETVKRYESE